MWHGQWYWTKVQYRSSAKSSAKTSKEWWLLARALASRQAQSAGCRLLSDAVGDLDDADSSAHGDARRSASIHAGRLSFADADAVAVAGLEGCGQSGQGRQGPALPAARTHARTPGLGCLATQFLTAGTATEKQNPFPLRMCAHPQTRAGRTADHDPENKRGHNHNSPDFTAEGLACPRTGTT